MDCVEEGFDVDFALDSFSVRAHLDEASRELLAVVAVRVEFFAVVEIKLRGDLLDAGIHQNVLSVKDYDRVDNVLKISYLMGADDNDRILACVLHHS